jgi:hypothetical protein
VQLVLHIVTRLPTTNELENAGRSHCMTDMFAVLGCSPTGGFIIVPTNVLPLLANVVIPLSYSTQRPSLSSLARFALPLSLSVAVIRRSISSRFFSIRRKTTELRSRVCTFAWFAPCLLTSWCDSNNHSSYPINREFDAHGTGESVGPRVYFSAIDGGLASGVVMRRR